MKNYMTYIITPHLRTITFQSFWDEWHPKNKPRGVAFSSKKHRSIAYNLAMLGVFEQLSNKNYTLSTFGQTCIPVRIDENTLSIHIPIEE